MTTVFTHQVRPTTGRIEVVVEDIGNNLREWRIEGVQRTNSPEHAALIGACVEVEGHSEFRLSKIRPGVPGVDTQEVIFIKEDSPEYIRPLPGCAYVMLITTIPGCEVGDFEVQGVCNATTFMAAQKEHLEMRSRPREKQRSHVQLRKKQEEERIDRTSIYEVRGTGGVFMFRGFVDKICRDAMIRFGTDWVKEVSKCNWYKKEGVRYSTTPSPRPTLVKSNGFLLAAIEGGKKESAS